MGFAEFVAMVASFIALNAFAIDMMLPALPDIGHALNIVRENDRQAVLTVFLIGFAVGQLAVGPLADRFGRKPVLLAGLVIYIGGALLCAVVPDFTTLLAARLVSGLGAASSRVVIVAVVRDCYGGRRMASVMSFAMMIFIAVPVFAPSVGQVVVLLWPWQAIFLLLAAAGAATMVWCAMRLPETLRAAHRRRINARDLAAAFGTLATNRQTLGYTLAGGIMQGGLYAFLFSAQQVLGEYYRLGPYFPLAFAAATVTISLSSFLNARLVGRLGMRAISHGASLAFLALGLVFGVPVLWGGLAFAPFMAILSAVTFLIGLTFANFNALAMEPQGRIAGTASSFLGATTTGIAVVIGGAVAYAYDGSLRPLALGYVGAGLAVVAVLLVTERGRLFEAHHRPPAS
jgi:DHA1 family bicyclomycin/chloramphenicol resistance-like MFS transporter